MNKRFLEIFVPLLFTLLLSQRVFADDTIVNVDLNPVTSAINNLFSGVNQSIANVQSVVSNLPGEVVKAFTDFFRQEFAGFLNPLLLLAKSFLTTNPDPQLLFGLWQTIIYIISLFYLLLFLIVGLLFLFSSFDSARRATAKEWFKSSIFLVVGVNASFMFYQLFLGLGAAVANYLWVSEFEQLFSNTLLSSFNMILVCVYSGSALLAFVTLFVRYLVLLLGTVLFPIGIFFYFIPPLKAWGKMLFELLFAAVLMQIVDVIVFIGASAVWKQFTGAPDIAGWAPIMAFSLIAIINSFMIVFSGMKAVNSITKEFPEVVAIAKFAGQTAIGALL